MKEIEVLVDLLPWERIRVDKYVARLGLLRRSQFEAQKLRILQDGQILKFSHKVQQGDRLQLHWEEPQEPSYEGEPLELNILFENQDVLVIDKPQGMVVHPGAGNHRGTLVHGLLYHNRELLEAFGGHSLRPGIVHRIDKDTSGLIISAKHPDALKVLVNQFRDRSTEKYYLTLVKGRPPKRRGDIEGYIVRDERNRKKFRVHPQAGKYALSRYEVLQSWEKYSLLQVKIETGRTHQIRVHLLSLGCPVLGDTLYARKDNSLGNIPLMLHSWKLGIRLPGEEEMRFFEAPIPLRFKEVQQRLDQEAAGGSLQ